MRLRAIVFDVDWTLAETEREGHLPACNEAFATLGFPVRWTWEEWEAMLCIPSSARRMRLALERLSPPLVRPEVEAAVVELAELKRRLYAEKYVSGLPLRPGVRALIREALARGVRLAIVSTSHEHQIRALLRHHLPEAGGLFDPILGQEAGVKTASGSPLYRRCLALLGTPPEETLAIEDSEVGLRAAHAAGLPCAVIYNDYTFGEPFAGAALTAPSLELFDLDRLAALCLPEARPEAAARA